MEPYHLEREELEYELNLRGVTEISGTRRNLAKMVSEELRVEKGDGVVYEWSPWLIDYDLKRCEKHLADMNRMIRDDENFEYLPREMYSRLLHYEARIQRLQPMGHEVIAVVNLKRDLQGMIQTISAKIERTVTRPRVSLTPARQLPTQIPKPRDATLGSRGYASTPNLRMSEPAERTIGAPPSYSGDAMITLGEAELEDERDQRINRETPWRHALIGRGERGGVSLAPIDGQRGAPALSEQGDEEIRAPRREASLRNWSTGNNTDNGLHPRDRNSGQNVGSVRRTLGITADDEEGARALSAQRSLPEDPHSSNGYREQRHPEDDYQPLFGHGGERISTSRDVSPRRHRESAVNVENAREPRNRSPVVDTNRVANDNLQPNLSRERGLRSQVVENQRGGRENPYFRAVPGEAPSLREGGGLSSRPAQQRPPVNSMHVDQERQINNTERPNQSMEGGPANRDGRVRDWVSDQQRHVRPDQRHQREPLQALTANEGFRIHPDEREVGGDYRYHHLERRPVQEIVSGVSTVRHRDRTTHAERPPIREEEMRRDDSDQIWNFRRRAHVEPFARTRRSPDGGRDRVYGSFENPSRFIESYEPQVDRRDWYNRDYVSNHVRRSASANTIVQERRDVLPPHPYPSEGRPYVGGHDYQPGGGMEQIRRVRWAADDHVSNIREDAYPERSPYGPVDNYRYGPANRDRWPAHYGSGSSLPMPKPVPVNRWRIYFSGEVNPARNELSIHDFLAQVDMFRRSEGIPEAEMIRQIIHLLRGSASLWYQTVYYSIQSWAEFVAKLKAKFLPNDYTFSLLSEIERRKQGESEPVGLYISDMERKFRAMPLPFDELHRVYYIRRNLQSRIRTWIASADASTVSELEAICKRAEANGEVNAEIRGKVPPKIWNPPRRRDGRVEIMYASDCSEGEEEYRGSTESIHEILTKRPFRSKSAERAGRLVSRGTQSGSSNELICYNCGGKNHGWRDCKEDRKGIFCYLCGQKDAMVDDGHTCSKNGQGGSVNQAGPKKAIQ